MNNKTNRYYLERRIEKKYGITYSSYLILLGEQDRKCAVCRKRKKLVVDHDHATNRVRGLLCGSCNRAIGFIGDDPSVAEGMAAYLRKPYPKLDIVKPLLPNSADLNMKLGKIFTERQKELVLKKASGVRLNKTEQEYFSRVIKKRLLALAHPDTYLTAQRVLYSI